MTATPDTPASRRIHLWPLLIFLALITSCSGSKPRPAWVDKPSALLSPATHINGTGRHRYSKPAKEQARGQVLDQLGFNRLPHNRYTVRNNAAATLIQARQRRLAETIPIVDTWVEGGSQHHVLAGISRSEAATTLHKLIADLDALTRTQIDKATKERVPLRRITLAGAAVHAQYLRRHFAAASKEVYPQRPVLREIWQGNRLEKDYIRMLRRIRMYPLVTHDDSNVLADALKAGLTDAGFGTGTRNDTDFQLNTTLTIDDREKSKDGTRISAQLGLELKEGQKLRGNEDWKLEFLVPAGQEEQEVISNALQRKLGRDLLPTILGFAEQP